ncbi:MAG: hypothetical protein IPJ65_02445 [Archangiaceae bacterium]|nr:hypothetical protein [Archangiaceae bacterium]
MAKGGAPSQDQLLELMKRAAEELKHAQEEARTAVQALQKEQAAHEKTEQELEQALKAAKGTKSKHNADDELLKDQIEAERENGKTLAARVKELEAALDGAATELERLKNKSTEADTAISVAAQQEEAKRQRLVEEHQKTIASLKELHDQALDDVRREANEAETEHQGLLDDAAGNLVQVEQQLQQEKEKHQGTAQKLLETRSRARELEQTLAAEQERVKALEAAATQLADSHQQALREAAEAHRRASAALEQRAAAAQGELTQVTERWREVERQYEALHREMLLTLEQRDEARRLLENERAERERLSKVLSQR